MGLLPLVSIVARPVKHVRLVTALLKATALMRFKAQVCCSLLNVDPLAYLAFRPFDAGILLCRHRQRSLMQCPPRAQHSWFKGCQCILFFREC